MIKTKLNIDALPQEFIDSVAKQSDVDNLSSQITDTLTNITISQATNDITINANKQSGDVLKAVLPSASSSQSGVMSSSMYNTLVNVNNKTDNITERLELLEGDNDGSIQDRIDTSIANAANITPETLQTMQNISTWLNDNEDSGSQLVQQVNDNINDIKEINDKHDILESTVKINNENIIKGDTIVGQAREIHSRNGKTVTDSFLARTTAGNGTIGDGVATLKSVGGNIVKNLVDFESFSCYPSVTDAILERKDNMIIISTSKDTQHGIKHININLIPTHLYYISCIVYSDKESSIYLFIKTSGLVTNISEKTWTHVSSIIRCNNEEANQGQIAYINYNRESRLSIFNYCKVIDLTEMYGAGNEPDKDTCDKLFGTIDALPQGLTIANPTEFKSVGYNQFNPENVLKDKYINKKDDGSVEIADAAGYNIAVVPCLPCKIGVGENNGYCIHGAFDEGAEKVYLTPLNPMEVESELYMHELTKDADKGTYVPQIKGYMLVEVPNITDLCVHFLWSEDCDRNTYEPYHESVIKLPTIPEMPEYGLAGMQSSGILACDEIDFEKGVYRKKIGSVDMGSLNWKYDKYTDSSQSRFVVRKIDFPLIKNSGSVVCEKYRYGKLQEDKVIYTTNYTNEIIGIKDTSITDIDTFKTSISDIMLYYELAEPIEYPLPKVDNSYISSDYGIEQFDSTIPCNANNLYYMRSLAGETRNFLDKMYANTGKNGATEVADYITANIEDNKTKAEEAPNLALRALYVAAGAEYNDTSNHIVKDTPWKNYVDSTDYKAQWDLDVVNGSIQTLTYRGKTYEYVDDNGTWKIIAKVGDKMIWDDTKVIHRAGYYYLNGLGDITKEQMLSIYDIGRTVSPYSDALFSNAFNALKNFVTNIPAKLTGGEGTAVRFYYICAGNSNIKVFRNTTNTKTWSNTIHCAWKDCSKLRHIVPIVDVNGATIITNITNAFNNCSSLVNCHLCRLKFSTSFENSPLISKYSILNTIKDAIPTTAITITLHADAYARLVDDVDIVNALKEKNGYIDENGNPVAGTLPTGASINLVSA